MPAGQSHLHPGMPKSSAKQLMCELPVKPKAVHIKIVDLHLNGPFFLLPLWEHFILTGLKGLLGLLLNKPFMITGHFQLWEKNTEVRFSLNLLRTWHFCDVCSSFYSSQNHNFFFFSLDQRDCAEHHLKLRNGAHCSFPQPPTLGMKIGTVGQCWTTKGRVLLY